MSIQSVDTLADEHGLEKRTIRAARDCMTVIEEAPGVYSVSTESGSEYRVDPALGACTCADMEYREPSGGCKHIRRVQMATDSREIPDIDGVDPFLTEASR